MNHFIKYGVASDLAQKAVNSGLSLAMVRATSLEKLQSLHNLSLGESKNLKKAVERQPIDTKILNALLYNSLFKCNVCEGTSGPWYIIHHIEAHSNTQDNRYDNLIVLCPNHHASAHGAAGLAQTLSASQLKQLKRRWELGVSGARRHRAAGSFEVSKLGVDYANPKRLEECCIALLGEVPTTSRTNSLQEQKILTQNGCFNEKFVREELSGGRYLFDYLFGAEINHWRELVIALSSKSTFHDLNKTIRDEKHKLPELEGQLSYFTGEAIGCEIKLPTNGATFTLVAELGRFRFEWILNSDYLMSMTTIRRMRSLEKYAIYGIVRSVKTDSDSGMVIVSSTPLLITLPAGLVGYSSLPDIKTELDFEPDAEEIEGVSLMLQTHALDKADESV